ncbi:hypothetical protein VFPBJ_05941 [Purpureocillium lilacinum]|uniref:Uncharacterized protein n=1 Tax=Purpureocillium lilacinum TaxID=33203 RepID=A0A179GQY1_PURLI|nr:hypothetical protein VFPBJ_05941 [Purpureocillium lilacinum]
MTEPQARIASRPARVAFCYPLGGHLRAYPTACERRQRQNCQVGCRSTGKVGEGSLGREYKGHIDSPNCGQAVCWKVPNRKRLFPPPEREAASLQPGNTPA